MGRMLQKKYEPFLEKGGARIVSIVSASDGRCIDTGRAISEGLLGFSDLLYKVNDSMLQFPPPDCPAFFKISQLMMGQEKLIDLERKNAELISRLSELTGENMLTQVNGETVADMIKVSDLSKTLGIHQENGKSLPDWATPQVLQSLKQFEEVNFCTLLSSRLMQKLLVGMFLQDLLDEFAESLRENTDKVLLYETHNWEIGALLRILNGPKSMLPYASSIVFELHKHEKDGRISINSYYVDEHREMTPVAPSTCSISKECSYLEYSIGLDPFLVRDLNTECQSDVAKEEAAQTDVCYQGIV